MYVIVEEHRYSQKFTTSCLGWAEANVTVGFVFFFCTCLSCFPAKKGVLNRAPFRDIDAYCLRTLSFLLGYR
jgi:hypothetical protein